MKRYFEIIGERLTVELDVTPQGAILSVEEIEKEFGNVSKLRELTQKEFNKLTSEYKGKKEAF